MRIFRCCIASSRALLVGCVLFAQHGAILAGPTAENGDWPTYAADLRSTKYSSLDLINPTNVRDLRIVWRWKSPDIDIVRQNPSLHLNLFEATPLAIDGVLYVITNLSQIAAIDAATGKTRWVYDPGVYRLGTPERTGFVHRGVAAWGPPGARRILAETADGYLIALDARSGALIREFGTEGRVDLTQGLRRPVNRISYGIDSPPLVVGDIVVVGSFVRNMNLTVVGGPAFGRLISCCLLQSKDASFAMELCHEDSPPFYCKLVRFISRLSAFRARRSDDIQKPLRYLSRRGRGACAKS